MNEGLVLEDSIVLNYGCIISFHFFFSRDAHFLRPIVGLDCLGHQSAGFSPIDPFGNAYDLHLSSISRSGSNQCMQFMPFLAQVLLL